jgi:hypothetical protein
MSVHASGIASILAMAFLAACGGGTEQGQTSVAQKTEPHEIVPTQPAKRADTTRAPIVFSRDLLNTDFTGFKGAIACPAESVVEASEASITIEMGADPTRLTLRAEGDPGSPGWEQRISLAAASGESFDDLVSFTALSADSFSMTRFEVFEGREFAVSRLYVIADKIQELPQEMLSVFATGTTTDTLTAYRDAGRIDNKVFTTRKGAKIEVVALRIVEGRAYALVISETGLCGWAPISDLPPLSKERAYSFLYHDGPFGELVEIGCLSVAPALLIEDRTDAALDEVEPSLAAATIKASSDGPEWSYRSVMTEYGTEDSYLKRDAYCFDELVSIVAPGKGLLYVRSRLFFNSGGLAGFITRKYKETDALTEVSQPLLVLSEHIDGSTIDGSTKEFPDAKLFLDSWRSLPFARVNSLTPLRLLAISPGAYGVVTLAGIVFFLDYDDARLSLPSGP